MRRRTPAVRRRRSGRRRAAGPTLHRAEHRARRSPRCDPPPPCRCVVRDVPTQPSGKATMGGSGKREAGSGNGAGRSGAERGGAERGGGAGRGGPGQGGAGQGGAGQGGAVVAEGDRFLSSAGRQCTPTLGGFRRLTRSLDVVGELLELSIELEPAAHPNQSKCTEQGRRRLQRNPTPSLRLSLPGRSPVAGVDTLSHARQWDAVFLSGMRRRSVDSLQRTAGHSRDGQRRRAAPAHPARHGPPLRPRWALGRRNRTAGAARRGGVDMSCFGASTAAVVSHTRSSSRTFTHMPSADVPRTAPGRAAHAPPVPPSASTYHGGVLRVAMPKLRSLRAPESRRNALTSLSAETLLGRSSPTEVADGDGRALPW